jgi:hypothetical protein
VIAGASITLYLYSSMMFPVLSVTSSPRLVSFLLLSPSLCNQTQVAIDFTCRVTSFPFHNPHFFVHSHTTVETRSEQIPLQKDMAYLSAECPWASWANENQKNVNYIFRRTKNYSPYFEEFNLATILEICQNEGKG